MNRRFVVRASSNFCTAADWDACWVAYDELVSSGEINNMDYDELVDAISEMADVPSQTAYTIVDEFIANEDDRVRFAYASTRARRSSAIRASRRSVSQRVTASVRNRRNNQRSTIQASTGARYFGRRVEIDENNDIELICYDPEYDEEFEKYIGQGSTAAHNLRMLRKDYYFDVSENLLKKIEELI